MEAKNMVRRNPVMDSVQRTESSREQVESGGNSGPDLMGIGEGLDEKMFESNTFREKDSEKFIDYGVEEEEEILDLENPEHVIKNLFRYYDENKSGFLETMELKCLILDAARHSGVELKPSQIADIIKLIDVQDAGAVPYQKIHQILCPIIFGGLIDLEPAENSPERVDRVAYEVFNTDSQLSGPEKSQNDHKRAAKDMIPPKNL
jgi:hypothetical protein